ncbi:hypothetical protein NL676_039076 [Syzygium grande]|nr:hypothetical protein NL676_039076 [Syzygium grande]
MVACSMIDPHPSNVLLMVNKLRQELVNIGTSSKLRYLIPGYFLRGGLKYKPQSRGVMGQLAILDVFYLSSLAPSYQRSILEIDHHNNGSHLFAQGIKYQKMENLNSKKMGMHSYMWNL